MRKPKMRKLLYLALIVVLALTVAWRVSTLVEDDDEEGKALASTPEQTTLKQTTPAPTTEHTWPEYRTVADIPIYPGANPLHLAAKDREALLATRTYPSTTQYKKLEWRFFITDDGVAQVISFYKDTMPYYGWEESAAVSADKAGWAFWQTQDLQRGVTVILGPTGSETILSMWIGEGYIPPPVSTQGSTP